MTTESKLPFVLCIWNDAWTDEAESVIASDAKIKHKAAVFHTTGWLLYEDEGGISIANEYCPEDDTYRGRTFIPKGMMDQVIPVKLAKARAKKPKTP